MDSNETATVSLPLEIGKKLGGAEERGRIPVRVTIEGIPFYSALFAKSVFDEWEVEYHQVGFYLYLSAEMRRRVPSWNEKQLDLRFVREEHTVGQRGRPVPKRLLDRHGR